MVTWLANTFRVGRRSQQIVDLFGMRRNNNRNGLMLSIIGLGLGAAAFSLLRGRIGNDNLQPIQNTLNELRD